MPEVVSAISVIHVMRMTLSEGNVDAMAIGRYHKMVSHANSRPRLWQSGTDNISIATVKLLMTLLVQALANT